MLDLDTFRLDPGVDSALVQHRPVVALESTVIAHGLPRPQNLETANRLEQIVRDAGAIPATIAILAGQICVGLDQDQVKRIAESDDIRKVSTRDLAIAVTNKWNGATTVASTIWIAHRAGIKVLATGGIGGVHRGLLPDVSADLPELARTPVVVVCSGPKIVLDLPATREWLETHGIAVVGYQCDEMPAFYSRKSGLPIDARVDSPDEVAQLVKAQRALGVNSALLITVPVPADAEIPVDTLEAILNDSLLEAERKQIAGRDVTPFLLSRMSRKSQGATLRANIALLENNARLAAEIARAVSETESR
jgi:pseudouridine-5'-phosphate glycosidase